MADIYKGELQDNLGNTVYPHTESDVVFCADGETVQEKFAGYDNAIGGVTGRTDSLEVGDSNILATSKSVNTLSNQLGGFTPIVDESGKITGYKTKIGGADTVFPFSDNYYEEYKVSVNSNSTSELKLTNGTIVSNDSNTLVSMTDNYLFTALKPCRVIIYHCGQAYSGNNTKLCYVNGKNINSFTEVCERFETTLESGDTLYVARIVSQAYWSTNVSYLRFEPIK